MRAFPLGAVDRTRTFTPLGLRFWDAAFDRPITGRLVVRAWLTGGPFPPIGAIRSPGGVYSFHGLPCQTEAEFPGALEAPESAGPELDYTVVVDDPSGAFLPAVFTLTLPLGYRGEFLSTQAGSHPAGAGRAYLFSAPSRPVPTGAVVLRGDLEDADRGGPASWAVVRATVEGREVVGVAGGDGRVLLLGPMPEVERLSLGSPPGSGQGPVAAAAWSASLRVEYDPSALRYPLAGAPQLPPSWPARPSLKSVLDEQEPALVTTVEGAAPVSEWSTDVEYGEALQLRTHGAGGERLSSLWVHAAASIP